MVLKTIAGPDGDLTGDIRPVEALVCLVRDEQRGQYPELNVLIQIEEADLPILEKHGNRFWITFSGHIVPFALSIYEPD